MDDLIQYLLLFSLSLLFSVSFTNWYSKLYKQIKLNIFLLAICNKKLSAVSHCLENKNVKFYVSFKELTSSFLILKKFNFISYFPLNNLANVKIVVSWCHLKIGLKIKLLKKLHKGFTFNAKQISFVIFYVNISVDAKFVFCFCFFFSFWEAELKLCNI